jgi:hypothetical protein
VIPNLAEPTNPGDNIALFIIFPAFSAESM